MKKELKLLADEMRILKLKDKAIFLRNIKKYAILFDPQHPQDIPECPVDERAGFEDIMMKHLFYALRGHCYGHPKYPGTLSEKEIKEQAQDDILHNRIWEGLNGYCYASESDKKLFERRVKMPKLLAPFLRKKSVLDHNFR